MLILQTTKMVGLQILILMYLVCLSEEQDQLDWTIERKLTTYGQNLTLFCHLDDCCRKPPGWKIFKENKRRTIISDIRLFNVTSESKYIPTIKKNGFTLTIRNLTRKDVNISYGCMHGLDIGPVKFLSEKGVFQNETSMDVESLNINKGDEKIGRIVGIILGIVEVLIGAAIVCYIRRQKQSDKDFDPHEEIVPLHSMQDTTSENQCPDRTRYARQAWVVMDIFPQMIREIIEKRCQPDTMYNLIDNVQPLNKRFSDDILLRLREGYSNLTTVDLYKMCTLLLPKPEQGWGYLPKDENKTISDDIERIKVEHESFVRRTTAQVTDTEQKHFLQTFKDVANRFDLYLSKEETGSFEQEILNLQNYIFENQEQEETLIQRAQDVEGLKCMF